MLRSSFAKSIRLQPLINRTQPHTRIPAPTLSSTTTTSRHISSTSPIGGPILLQEKDGFGFARSNPRPAKPRNTGVTEIRGPYYSVYSS